MRLINPLSMLLMLPQNFKDIRKVRLFNRNLLY